MPVPSRGRQKKRGVSAECGEPSDGASIRQLSGCRRVRRRAGVSTRQERATAFELAVTGVCDWSLCPL